MGSVEILSREAIQATAERGAVGGAACPRGGQTGRFEVWIMSSTPSGIPSDGGASWGSARDPRESSATQAICRTRSRRCTCGRGAGDSGDLLFGAAFHRTEDVAIWPGRRPSSRSRPSPGAGSSYGVQPRSRRPLRRSRSLAPAVLQRPVLCQAVEVGPVLLDAFFDLAARMRASEVGMAESFSL